MLRVWRLLDNRRRGWAQGKPNHRTAKWRDTLEQIEEEDDLLNGEELKLFQSVAASSLLWTGWISCLQSKN